MRGRIFNFGLVVHYRVFGKEDSQAINGVDFTFDLPLWSRFGRNDGAEGVGESTSANNTKH